MKYTIKHLKVVSSTQDEARQLASRGTPEGAVVVAAIQTGGRGRQGRDWLSPAGGLWFSILLRPDFVPAAAPGLNLLAAVAITEAIRAATGLAAGIKWPNDILIDGRKLGGILTEMKTAGDVIEYVLLGAGINVNFAPGVLPSDLRLPVATLMNETGRTVDLGRLLDEILTNFKTGYENWPDGQEEILDRWRARSVTLGRRVTVTMNDHALTGLARDIDAAGALLVADDAGTVHQVYAGDVTLSFD